MRRDQLEHAIRTACQIIGQPAVIVVGSQSILGTYREEDLPAEATMSVEVDILPIADDNAETARLADLIEGVAGEFSPFEQLHGFSIDGVDLETSVLPDRMVSGQGGPLRREAVRTPGEGPELRRSTTRRSTGRPRRDHRTAHGRSWPTPAGRRTRDRLVGVAHAMSPARWSSAEVGSSASMSDGLLRIRWASAMRCCSPLSLQSSRGLARDLGHLAL
jgi:hypothetical protein